MNKNHKSKNAKQYNSLYLTALRWALVGSCCGFRSDPHLSGSDQQIVSCTLRTEHFTSTPCFSYDPKWNLPELNVFLEHHDDELPGPSKDDQEFLKKLSSEVLINDQGNIELPLPSRRDNPILPNNQTETYCRNKNTLNRLRKDSDKLKQCIDVMQKYIDSDHMEEVPANETIPTRPNRAWWIPVFHVTHPKKMKVRIVFDSAAKYHGTCLNDELLPGPDVLNSLKLVLIGFRAGYIAFSADVECMFHNFRLKILDSDYLRFHWFKNNDPTKEITQYRAKVHVFGNCSSSAVACLGLRYAASLPGASNSVRLFINEQLYVDDGLGSADTVESAVKTLEETVETLKKYNIRLHKIVSSPNVINAFPESERAVSATVELDEKCTQTALGLIWNTAADILTLRTDVPERPFTRRGILATVNSVFDPLRICLPIILEGKHLQHKIILSNNSSDTNFWDEEIPDEFREEWESWKSSIAFLSGLSVPRCYRPVNFGPNYSIELHGFCDASLDDTGCVIYTRSINDKDEKSVSFVTGSSKIVPKSSPSIPRLELCAAVDLSG